MVDKVEGWFKAEDESAQHRLEQLRAADALVLGRETYGFLSEFWPAAEGALTWNAQLLGANAAVAVAALKAEIPGQLISYGCGELANDLARHGLVDEIRFWLHPVVWGGGVRAFHAGERPIRMRLVGARTFPSDVVLLSYQPLGSHSLP